MKLEVEQMMRISSTVESLTKKTIPEYKRRLEEEERREKKLDDAPGTEVTEKEVKETYEWAVKKCQGFKKEGVKSVDKMFGWQIMTIVFSITLGLYGGSIPSDFSSQLLVGLGVPAITISAVIPTLRKEGKAWLRNRTIVHNFCNGIEDMMGAVSVRADYSYKDQNKYIWRYIDRLFLVKGVLTDPDLGFDQKMNKLEKLFEVPGYPPPSLVDEGVLD